MKVQSENTTTKLLDFSQGLKSILTQPLFSWFWEEKLMWQHQILNWFKEQDVQGGPQGIY